MSGTWDCKCGEYDISKDEFYCPNCGKHRIEGVKR